MKGMSGNRYCALAGLMKRSNIEGSNGATVVNDLLGAAGMKCVFSCIEYDKKSLFPVFQIISACLFFLSRFWGYGQY